MPRPTKKNGWYVEIVETATNKVEKQLGPYETENLADKAESGVSRNLDHEKYHTQQRQSVTTVTDAGVDDGY